MSKIINKITEVLNEDDNVIAEFTVRVVKINRATSRTELVANKKVIAKSAPHLDNERLYEGLFEAAEKEILNHYAKNILKPKR